MLKSQSLSLSWLLLLHSLIPDHPSLPVTTQRTPSQSPSSSNWNQNIYSNLSNLSFATVGLSGLVNYTISFEIIWKGFSLKSREPFQWAERILIEIRSEKAWALKIFMYVDHAILYYIYVIFYVCWSRYMKGMSLMIKPFNAWLIYFKGTNIFFISHAHAIWKLNRRFINLYFWQGWTLMTPKKKQL